MKVVSMSDVHLDTFKSFATPTDKVESNSRLENILWAVEQVFNYAKENNIKAVVSNGDLFNQRTKMSPATYSYCIKRILEMFHNTNKGTTLYMNIGNHEQSSRYVEPNSVTIFEEFSTKDYPIKVAHKEVELYNLEDDTGLMLVPYTEDIAKSKQAINDTLDQVTKDKLSTVVFAHLGIDGSTSGRWSHKLGGAYNLSDLGWNRRYIKAICCGHYHRKQTLKEKGKKKAWYQGDLTELNFNDIQEDGMGASRGFDVIDTATGDSSYKPLSDSLPKFDIIDLSDAKTSTEELLELMGRDYVRLIVHDKETYEQLTKAYQESEYYKPPYANIQLKVEPKQEQDLEIEATDSDADILKAYMKKYYPDPDLENLALDYLEKAQQ